MPICSIGKLMSATEELKALSARARRLRDLQAVYFRSAPRALAEASRIKDYRAGTLVISACHAAIATKLRQIAPRLLTAINKADPQVTGLKIEVQVSGSSRETEPNARKRALSVDAVDHFAALAGSLPAGKLKLALTNLVSHHRPGTTKVKQRIPAARSDRAPSKRR
jgi:hypothetical protein